MYHVLQLRWFTWRCLLQGGRTPWPTKTTLPALLPTQDLGRPGKPAQRWEGPVEMQGSSGQAAQGVAHCTLRHGPAPVQFSRTELGPGAHGPLITPCEASILCEALILTDFVPLPPSLHLSSGL